MFFIGIEKNGSLLYNGVLFICFLLQKRVEFWGSSSQKHMCEIACTLLSHCAHCAHTHFVCISIAKCVFCGVHKCAHFCAIEKHMSVQFVHTLSKPVQPEAYKRGVHKIANFVGRFCVFGIFTFLHTLCTVSLRMYFYCTRVCTTHFVTQKVTLFCVFLRFLAFLTTFFVTHISRWAVSSRFFGLLLCV